MAQASKRPCNSKLCPILITTGRYCDQHKHLANANRPNSDKNYNTARWKKLREWQRQREPLCRLCLADGKIVAMLHVDHILPVRDGGGMFDPNNLQSLCRDCHDVKTQDDLNKRNGKQQGATSHLYTF